LVFITHTYIHTYIHKQPQKGKRVSPPYTLNNMGQRCACICMYVHICAQTICIASFVQSVPSFVHKTGQSSPTKWDWGPPPPPTKREGVILFLQRPDCCTVQFFCFLIDYRDPKPKKQKKRKRLKSKLSFPHAETAHVCLSSAAQPSHPLLSVCLSSGRVSYTRLVSLLTE